MYLQGQNGLLSTFRARLAKPRGTAAYVFAGLLIGFYLLLYFEDWFANQLRHSLVHPVLGGRGPAQSMVPVRLFVLRGMIGGGIYYLRRHGNSRYNQLRIGTNIVVQVLFGFSLPFFMHIMGQKDFYFSYIWPLKIEYLYPQDITQYPFYIMHV